MSEPFDPASDPEYAAALDRFLDGLKADGPLDAEVRADTDSIARALGLIGGALAGEGTAAGVAAGTAAGPGAPVAGGGTVVAMSSWRSKLNPRVLAAAASLVVVLGVGIPLTMNSTGGNTSNDSTTAAGMPEPAADRAQSESAPMAAPGAAPLDAEAYGDAGALAPATTDASGKAAPNAAGGDEAPVAAGATSGSAQAGAGAPTAEDARKASTADAANQLAAPQFADAVACARAIVVGTVSAVRPAPDGSHYDVTILVSEWIAPGSGPLSVTHRVFGNIANSPGDDESVRVGMRRLFVVAASPEERIYAFRQADWPETRKKIAAIRAERAGAGC